MFILYSRTCICDQVKSLISDLYSIDSIYYVKQEEGGQVRFLLVVVLIMASAALFVLDMTTPHALAANAPAPNCVSTIPPLVSGTPAPAPTAPGTLFINEVLTNPATAWNCADLSPSAKDIWIELYNAQNQPVDLSSSHAEIDIGVAKSPYPLPNPSVIAPLGFLVVFPLIDSSTSTISSARLEINGTIIDSISIPTLQPDQSYARIPDGKEGIWQISNYPTIGASNSLTAPPPTPKPMQAKKVRAVGTKTAKVRRSSTSDTIASSNDYSSTASSTNDGTQPSWGTLQLPEGTASLPVTQVTGMPSSIPQQQAANASDLPKKIIISVSVVAVACALFWCWKHFLSP
jgi:hypothetical protein